MLLQCLAALRLSGDPLGLEGCQHSVQPQPFQALWAQREAKCSARVQQQPALEDLGKPTRVQGLGKQCSCVTKTIMLLPLLH